MKETEQSLLERNKIAATLGDELTQQVLAGIREQWISTAKSYIPTQNDPSGFGIHRAMGRVDAIDYLIALGKKATQPTEKGKANGK